MITRLKNGYPRGQPYFIVQFADQTSTRGEIALSE